jgi:uncharacterized protein (DUF1499 family)
VMPKLLKLCATVGVSIYAMTLTSCVTSPDVIFVDTTQDVVRLGDDVEGHIYYQKDGRWVRSASRVKIPAGWYAGGLPPE